MGERRGTKALELWCKRVTQGYDGVSIENMSTSWKDGLAFCALIHHFRPDLIDYDGLDKNDIYGNNELAFRIAENHLGIPALLDPEDMACVEIPDRLSILTYLSQFYQTFSSQATTPVKTSPESPTAVERPRTNPGSGQNPPTKLGAGVGGCRVCNQSVFLAQRLLISGHLFHRTCFKCARCGALLSVANYYETQDGKYCCETCPDEERLAAADAAAMVTSADERRPSAEDHAPSLRRAPSSLVGDRRAMFETLAAADCTDDVKASQQKNAARRPSIVTTTVVVVTDAAATTCCSDDNDSGVVVVGGDKKDDGPPDDEDTTTPTTSDKTSGGSPETLEDAPVPVADRDESPTTVDHHGDDDDKVDLVGPTPKNRLSSSYPSTDAIPPDDAPDGNGDPATLSDDLKRVLNAAAVAAESPRLADRESPDDDDPEIRTLANKLLKMDYYESNNTNKEVPVPSPRKKIKSPIATAVDNYPENLNPFDDEDEDDGKGKSHGDSTNPFDSDSDGETESTPPPLPNVIKRAVCSNPFSSDEDENETSTQPPPPRPRTMLSPMLKPRHQTHRKQSSASSISSFSTTPRKKKPAPPPPKSRQSLGNVDYTNNIQISSPNSLDDSSCSGSEPSSSVTNNEERYRLHKSTHGKWKRKKGPAPQCPIPQRRRIKPMPIEDIKQELLDIEIKQQELERQGVKLEKDIRLKCNEDLNNVDVEEMVLQLFELVNEKNELFRKHAELMYLRRQHNLEEEHAELEFQIRVLMARPDHTKTDSEKAREEELIQRLVEVVGRRNEIVENLEKDRLREAEEDRSVFNQIGTFAQDETLPCVKPVIDVVSVTNSKKNFSKRLLKNIKKVKSKKEKPEESSPSRSPSNSSYSKGTLKKFMTLGHSSRKYLRPKSS